MSSSYQDQKQRDHRITKSNWYRPSLNPLQPQKNNVSNNEEYRPKAPWDQVSNEVVDDFERNLEAIDTTVHHPWEEGSVEFRLREKELEKAKGYKYESLFEAPEMSADRKKQLEDYKYKPPFPLSNDTSKVQEKPAKRMNPNQTYTTRQPWAYGSIPSDPIKRKIFEKPTTSLWEVPKGDQGANSAPMISSGDPVLDNLRSQLKAHGASGIAGLARKFRIMDDDGNGMLDFGEFKKGIKECELVDLSDAAIKHLFLYFDRDDSGTISYDEFLVGIRVSALFLHRFFTYCFA